MAIFPLLEVGARRLPMVDDRVAEMFAHYQAVDEGTRLTRSPHGRLEFVRTQELLRRLLPPPPARVLDIGGATGIHAVWLAEDGYDVVLIDPVDHHVATAREVGTFGAREGDARSLIEADDSVDAVLLLGPLYHLTNYDDRLAALREAHRVLRPGGRLAAAAISRYLGVIEVGGRLAMNDEELELAAEVIEAGSYAPVLGFTHAHWHLPDELRDEVTVTGFRDVSIFGVEGPEWAVLDALGIEEFDRYVDRAVAVARIVETDPLAMAMSAHLLAVATKQD